MITSNEILEIVEQDASLEERLDVIAKQMWTGPRLKRKPRSDIADILFAILDYGAICFYEKLYFIQNLAQRSLIEMGDRMTFVEYLLEGMHPGEIVFEMMKPELVRIGTEIKEAIETAIIKILSVDK